MCPLHKWKWLRSATRLVESSELLEHARRATDHAQCTGFRTPGPLSITLLALRLPRQELFEIMSRGRSIAVAWASPELDLVERFFAFMGSQDTNMGSSLGFHVSESGRSFDPDTVDELYLRGRRKASEYSCWLSVGRLCAGSSDLPYRVALFKRYLDALGSELAAKVELLDGKLVVGKVQPAGELTVKPYNGESDGKNPRALEVCGFDSFEQMRSGLERALAALARSIVQVGFAASIPAAEYETQRTKLTHLAAGWTFDIYGRLSKPVEELVVEAERAGEFPARIPAFQWFMGAQETAVQAEIVLIPGGGYLELTTTYPHLNKVIAAAKKYTGLDFVVVDSEPGARESSG